MPMEYNVKYLVVLLALFISACENVNGPAVKCSGAQLKMVKKQYDLCVDSDYRNSFCLNRARKEQCDTVKNENNIN